MTRSPASAPLDFWGAVLKWRASASIIRASASFSVCPLA